MTPNKLEMNLRDAMAVSAPHMSEKQALEAALNVAEEWKMRLREIEEEEGDQG